MCKIVSRGRFCELISQEVNSRFCFVVRDNNLHESGFERLAQIIETTPGIALQDILLYYHVTARMKATLAYIIAHSIWYFYDSNWMQTRWTSETIRFVKEFEPERGRSTGFANFLPWKPYFSVRFGDKDPDAIECSELDGEIHQYPRVRELGIMLIEIATQRPLRSDEKGDTKRLQAARTNDRWLEADKMSQSETLWVGFDFPKYRAAAKNALDPKLFAAISDMQERRKTLYECIVSPLQELLEGTGWRQEFTKTGPLKSRNRPTPIIPLPEPEIPHQTGSRGFHKSSKRWLKKMNRCHEMLLGQSPIDSLSRVKIAILDTGLDDNTAFFQSDVYLSRIREWKDFVDDVKEPQDCHGHGTHLASLILKISPQSDLFIARVAKDPESLADSAHNVAKVTSLSRNICFLLTEHMLSTGQALKSKSISSQCLSGLRKINLVLVRPSELPSMIEMALLYSSQRQQMRGRTRKKCSQLGMNL